VTAAQRLTGSKSAFGLNWWKSLVYVQASDTNRPMDYDTK